MQPIELRATRARKTSTAIPWARLTWWIARCSASTLEVARSPPNPSPNKVKIDGSLKVAQARLIRVAPPQRKNTRPSDGETIGMDAEPLHQPNVLQVTVIVIASDVAGIMVGDFAFLAIGVPNAKAAPVFARRPLDLKARG